jgi:hypothetical protein
MKKSIFLCPIVCLLILFSGCKKDEDGKLSMKLRMWNNYESTSTKNVQKSLDNPIRLPFVDMVGYVYEMKVTTDEMKEGMKETDLNWITIYTSVELKGQSKRDFQFTLPVGIYKGFALWQGNDFFWVGDYNGTEIKIPSSNGGNSDRVYNAFGTDGLYVLNSQGEFTKVNNDEKIGVSFEIKEGQTTTVTCRSNFTAIDWYDNDESGTWSDGDEAGNPILPEGVSTMADFIVVYE